MAVRPLRGSRQHEFYPSVPTPSLKSLDSAFQLEEYISFLIAEDPHDVSRIVTPPMPEHVGDKRQSTELDFQDDDREETVDTHCWIYEHLRRLAQDLNHPLITTLQQECTRDSCPEMKAGEWLYLCVAHGQSNTLEQQCCAIDYILHTVDSATALLNSPRAFPSRIAIPQSSHRHFSSLARRLGRIFAHAYFQHREAFEQAEAESSLYSRYLALTSIFDLVPSDYLNIPANDGNPPTLQSASIEIGRPPSNDNEGRESPSGMGRSRTDTMVFAEGFSLPNPTEQHSSTYNARDSHDPSKDYTRSNSATYYADRPGVLRLPHDHSFEHQQPTVPTLFEFSGDSQTGDDADIAEEDSQIAENESTAANASSSVGTYETESTAESVNEATVAPPSSHEEANRESIPEAEPALQQETEAQLDHPAIQEGDEPQYAETGVSAGGEPGGAEELPEPADNTHHFPSSDSAEANETEVDEIKEVHDEPQTDVSEHPPAQHEVHNSPSEEIDSAVPTTADENESSVNAAEPKSTSETLEASGEVEDLPVSSGKVEEADTDTHAVQ